MTEYNLDKKQDRTPLEVVQELNDGFQSEYIKMIAEEQREAAALKSDINRLKGYNAFISFRILFSIAFILLFLASSLLYSGFAANRYMGIGIIVLIVLSLIAFVVLFLLAVFRRAFFRTGFTLAQILLGACAVIVAIGAWIQFGIVSYFLVSIVLVFVIILNHTSVTKKYNAAGHIASLTVSLTLMSLAVLCVLGVIREEQRNVLHERELYSRFAKYELFEEQEETCSTFSGVLLTAKDVLTFGDGETYRIADTVNEEIKVTAVGMDAFKDTRSIKTVVVPDSVTLINAYAFTGSEVRTVEIYSSEIYIEDFFAGSNVRIVRLLSPEVTKITVGEGCSISEDISIFVPEQLVWECRQMNPELADNIVPIK